MDYSLRVHDRVKRLEMDPDHAWVEALEPQLRDESALVDGERLGAARVEVLEERAPGAHRYGIDLHLRVRRGERGVGRRRRGEGGKAPVRGDDRRCPGGTHTECSVWQPSARHLRCGLAEGGDARR